MYYRHHSQHWLQKWFNAGSLMTPSLILVFWDLTLTGLWPLEMMKTLISCILDNTGLLPEPWILPLQWHVWLTVLQMDGCAPRPCSDAKRWPWYLYQLRVTSSQDCRTWNKNLLWQLYLLDSSGLVKSGLASSSTLWKMSSPRICTMSLNSL